MPELSTVKSQIDDELERYGATERLRRAPDRDGAEYCHLHA
jgi:hypothetical protein